MAFTQSDLQALTDADWQALVVLVQAEQNRRDTISSAQQIATNAGAAYASAVAAAAPIPWASVPDAIGPGVAVTWTDGNTWRNRSGTWLPKTATPVTYPLGWTQETGLPAATAWSGTASYKAGDLVTYNGITYRALQAITPNPTWTPDIVPALWTVA